MNLGWFSRLIFANANSNASTHTNYLIQLLKNEWVFSTLGRHRKAVWTRPTIIQARRDMCTAQACLVLLIGGLLQDTVPAADGHYSYDGRAVNTYCKNF